MKKIPFDLAKAKTPDNPDGLEVTDGYGRRVRIICTNLKCAYPIVAIVEKEAGNESCDTYTKEGVEFTACGRTESDLLLLMSETRNVVRWGFIYKDDTGLWTPFSIMYSSRKKANAACKVLARSGKAVRAVELRISYKEDEL